MSLLRACLIVVFLILSALTMSAACSSSSSTDCTANPFQCPSGTTCSLSTCTCATEPCTQQTCNPTFACVPSGDGTVGETCVAQPGSPACSDGLFCVESGGAAECLLYCNAANPCPQGSMCQAKTVELGPQPAKYPVVYVCESESDSAFPFEESGCGPPPPLDSGAGDVRVRDSALHDGPPTFMPDGGLPR